MNARLIFRIARTELAALFFSPIAWLLLVAFACQVGIDFMSQFVDVAKIPYLGRQITFSVTNAIFFGLKGLYEVIQDTIYIYIPLLTMNLMSREYASGSVKLLYSSPVSSWHIVMGKFVAMIFVSLFFVVILALPAVFVGITVPNMDVPLILSGLMGMFLLILTYCAIGIFMSSLTSYQVVAAVATFSALAFFNYIGQVAQSSVILREITYWLSIKGRATQMVYGLICSEDVIYFLVVIGLFIAMSIVKLGNEKRRDSLKVKIARYAGIVICAVVIGFISSRPATKGFLDVSQNEMNTLSVESQEVVNKLEGPLTITTYVNIFDKDFNVVTPRNQKEDHERFEKYTRFKPEIKMKYVYYYAPYADSSYYKKHPGQNIDQIAHTVMKKMGYSTKNLVSAESLTDVINLKEEDYRFVRVVERGTGQQARLRLYDDMLRHPNETEISAAMKKMISAPVTVGVLTGHNERSISRFGDQDYWLFATNAHFRSSLINQGFDVEELNLNEIDDVPANINILFVAEMRQSLTEKENLAIDRYLERGGNMIILADIKRQKEMNPLLEKFGVRLMSGIISQPSAINAYNLALSRPTEVIANKLKGAFAAMMRTAVQYVTMPYAGALEVVDTSVFKVMPALQTNAQQTWLEQQTENFLEETPTLDAKSGEALGAYMTAAILTRQNNDREQRIFVMSDADCWSNAELQTQRKGIVSRNFALISTVFRWLSYGEFPVSVTRAQVKDREIKVSPMQLPWCKHIFHIIIPALIAAVGFSILMYRRRG